MLRFHRDHGREAAWRRARAFCRVRVGLPVGRSPQAGWQPRLLPDQPFRILAILVKARGALVTREDLRRELWPENTFVDFDHSLNAGVKRLRESISDSATAPRFIETIPRRGYRFIAPVEIVAVPAETSIEVTSGAPDEPAQTTHRTSPEATMHHRRRIWLALGGIVVTATAAGVWFGTGAKSHAVLAA